jgi:hypothetical protein
MGIPLEMPPFLDIVLTLSAMLGLFAYIYRLAGKEGPPEGGRNGPFTWAQCRTPTTP